jgi:hypothetical protein
LRRGMRYSDHGARIDDHKYSWAIFCIIAATTIGWSADLGWNIRVTWFYTHWCWNLLYLERWRMGEQRHTASRVHGEPYFSGRGVAC